MAEKFQPVRLVSKDGETVVVARNPQAASDLQFGSGYRVSEDQTNLEPTGPKLDNGKLVDADAAPAASDAGLAVGDAVVSDAPEQVESPSTAAPAAKPAPKSAK